jgi:type IV fimbrial biogenesis protein FimT
MSKHSGFTLIELMVTIGIAGILMSIALPGFKSVVADNKLTSNINQLVSALNLARSEAVKRNLDVSIKKTGEEWEEGWTVFTDVDSDGTKGTGDILLRSYGAVPSNFTLRSTEEDYISYKATGQLSTAANVVFVFCDNSDGNNIPEANTARVININLLGRAGMGKNSDNNIPETMDGEINSCTDSPFVASAD